MKKKLHIIFLDFDDIKNPLLGAGQARATVEVGRRLVKMGHKLTVICSRYPGYKDRKENGLFYKHIAIGSSKIRLNNVFYILMLPLTILRLRGDVIVECFTAPITTLFSPLFTKIPVVAIPTSFEAERFAKLYHVPVDRIERFGLRFYKYFLPTSSYFEEKMRKHNQKVVTKIIPEGVGEEFFSIRKRKAEHILFLGRIDMSQKGIDLLLKAYAKSRKKIGYPLVIAGLGPDEGKVLKMIKKLKLENDVILVGPSYGEKKYKLLSRSLFVAIPSRHEGFSLFALEALASALPVVAFDIPGLSWCEGEFCRKAKRFDVEEYSKLLIKTAKNKDLQSIGKKGREFARNFTWEKVAADYEDFFYKEVLRA